MNRPSRQAPTTGNQSNGWKPTRAQTKLLRVLAQRAGETFEQPTSWRALQREIARLRGAAKSSQADGQADGKREQDRDDAAALKRALSAGPDSSIQPYEIEGYGSTAHYASGKRRKPADDSARGDERCRAIGAFPSPYRPGQKLKDGTLLKTRTDAQHYYKLWLKSLIRTHGRPVIEQLAALHGHLTGCYCRVHPCEREVLADAAAWAADQIA